MEGFVVEVTARQEIGSGAARRMRKAGFLPSVVYHAGETSTSVLISAREFIRMGSMARKSQVFTLKSNLEKLNGRSAIVKEVQMDYLKKVPTHVDFLALKDDEEVEIIIALKFVGEAPGVKLDGGILTILTHEVTVLCLPKFIPNEFTIDISSLKVGNSIHARDIKVPEGVKLMDSPDETIVSVVAPQAVQEAAPVAGAAGAVAGAEGAAAAAPGADAAAAKPGAAPAAAEKGKSPEKK